MTSTYTTNQGLEKPATGDRSGTWGTMTNTNMDMLDRSISGVGALSLTGTTTTLTTSDGSASDGNYKVLVLGGSPSGTNTITLSPNDGDKLYFVVNGSGQSVIFSQGTGANVTIANGAADIIYADGAGSGAAVSSYLANDFVFKTGDGAILNLQTSDTTVTASSVLGRLNFTAPDEASGTDAILLAASIAAISEGTFAADDNATKLSFMTGASEAAAEKMSLSSGGNLSLPTDSAVIKLGADQDVTITHVADTGLNIKQVTDADDKALILKLQTGETDIVVNDYIARLQFQAPDEAGGTDAITICAEISALSEGTFAADNNATSLLFATGASGTATAKMKLSSGGNLSLPTDSVVTSFGVDSDVTLTHNADSGLTLSAGANATQLTITTTEGGGSVAPTLNLIRASATPAVNDQLGYLNFVGRDSGGNSVNYAQIFANIGSSFTDGEEYGSLDFYCIEDGTLINVLKMTGSTATFTEKVTVGVNDTGYDVKFFGATSGAYMLWDESTDDLVLAGAAGLIIPDGGTIGSASDTDAIAIRSDGNVGIGSAGNSTIALQVTSTGADVAIQGASGAGHGIDGRAGHASYVGTMGFAYDTAHYGYLGYSTIGCYATTIQSGGSIVGVTLSISSTKNFRISHGLREGHDLVHSSIEGPQIDVVYRGKVELVNGQASIDIDSHYDMTPGTFEWLTKSNSVQTFTSNETGWDAVKSSFSGDTITIECQNSSSTDTISWMVIAERGDPDIMECSTTDNEGNLIIEPESEPELELPPPPEPEPPPEE